MEQQEMTLMSRDQQLLDMAKEIARGERALDSLRRAKGAATSKFNEAIRATEKQLASLRTAFGDSCLQAELPGMENVSRISPITWGTVVLSIPETKSPPTQAGPGGSACP